MFRILVTSTIQSKNGGGGIASFYNIEGFSPILACRTAKIKFLKATNSDFDLVPGTLSAKVLYEKSINEEGWTKQ